MSSRNLIEIHNFLTNPTNRQNMAKVTSLAKVLIIRIRIIIRIMYFYKVITLEALTAVDC